MADTRGFQFFNLFCCFILISLFCSAPTAYANASEEFNRQVSVEQPVTAEQLKGWFLGCSGILWERNHDDFQSLAGGDINERTIKAQKDFLSDWWSIENTNDLYESLDWIVQGGHRDNFIEDVNMVGHLDEASFYDFFKQYKKNDPNNFGRLNDFHIAWRYGEQLGDKNLMGWDYCRYMCLCRWGYRCGYLDEATAWKLIIPAGIKLQKTFDSWEEMGENYLIGRRYWSYGQTVKKGDLYDDAYMQLCDIPASPWNLYSWDMDLTDAEMLILKDIESNREPLIEKDESEQTVNPVKELSLDLGDLAAVENKVADFQAQGTVLIVPDQYPTIQLAIEAAKDGEVIFIKAGIYEASEKPIQKKSFRLVGQNRDQVIIHSTHTNVLMFHQCSSIVLSDVTVENRRTEVGKKATHAVSIAESDVDLLRCRVRNANSGSGIVYYASSKGTVQGCLVRDCQSDGVFASQKGTVVSVENCRFYSISNYGITASQGAQIDIHGVFVKNSGKDAVFAHGEKTRIDITDSLFRSNKRGVEFLKSASGRICNSIISDNRGVGIYVSGDGTQVVLNNVCSNCNELHGLYIAKGAHVITEAKADGDGYVNQFCDNKKAGLYLTSGASIVVEEGDDGMVTQLAGNGDCGVYIAKEAQAKIDRFFSRKNNGAGIRISGGQNVKITNSTCQNNTREGLSAFKQSQGITIENTQCLFNGENGIQITDKSFAVVSNNKSIGNLNYGILIKNSQVELTGNTSSQNGKSGLYLWGKATRGEFENNRFCNNDCCGIQIGSGSNITLSNNVCKDNRQEGIIVGGDPASTAYLVDNHCVNNYPSGILFQKGAGGCARGNHCEQNGWAGIAVRGKGTRPMIEGNTCVLNGAWGVVCWDWATPGWSEANILHDNGLGGIKIR